MTRDRKSEGARDDSDAKGKLGRLLEIEGELETMLRDTRKAAAATVEAARKAAEERMGRLQSELEEEDRELRERITEERGRTIASIQKEAEEQTARLNALDDAKVKELARHIVGLLLGTSDRGSS